MTKRTILKNQLDIMKNKKFNIIEKMCLTNNQELGRLALSLIELCIKTEVLELELQTLNK